MRKALMMAADTNRQNGAVGNMQYQFVRVKQQELTRFLALLETNRIAHPPVAWYNPFCLFPHWPAGQYSRSVLLGGYSSGFYPWRRQYFYLGLHQYKNDLSSVIETCRHELFHMCSVSGGTPYIVTEGLANKREIRGWPLYTICSSTSSGRKRRIYSRPAKGGIAGRFSKRAAGPRGPMNPANHRCFTSSSKLLVEVAEHPGDASQDDLYNLLFDWKLEQPRLLCRLCDDEKRLCREWRTGIIEIPPGGSGSFVMDYIRYREKGITSSHAFTLRFEELMKRLDNTIRALPLHSYRLPSSMT